MCIQLSAPTAEWQRQLRCQTCKNKFHHIFSLLLDCIWWQDEHLMGRNRMNSVSLFARYSCIFRWIAGTDAFTRRMVSVTTPWKTYLSFYPTPSLIVLKVISLIQFNPICEAGKEKVDKNENLDSCWICPRLSCQSTTFCLDYNTLHHQQSSDQGGLAKAEYFNKYKEPARQFTFTNAVILVLRSVTRCSMVALVEEMNCSHTVFNLRSTWVDRS